MDKSAAVIVSRLFDGGEEIGDHVTVTLPSLAFMTTEIKGAGIMGSISLPHVGFTESLEFSIDLRSMGENAAALQRPGVHNLELRFAQDVLTSREAVIKRGTKIFISGIPKSFNFGSVEVGNPLSSNAAFEVLRLRMVVDGEEVVLLDKTKYKFDVGGRDATGGIKSLI